MEYQKKLLNKVKTVFGRRNRDFLIRAQNGISKEIRSTYIKNYCSPNGKARALLSQKLELFLQFAGAIFIAWGHKREVSKLSVERAKVFFFWSNMRKTSALQWEDFLLFCENIWGYSYKKMTQRSWIRIFELCLFHCMIYIPSVREPSSTKRVPSILAFSPLILNCVLLREKILLFYEKKFWSSMRRDSVIKRGSAHLWVPSHLSEKLQAFLVVVRNISGMSEELKLL